MKVCYECSRTGLTACGCSYQKVITNNSSVTSDLPSGMIRIDYLNKEKEVRHTFVRKNEIDIGYELLNIINNGATDIFVYYLIK